MKQLKYIKYKAAPSPVFHGGGAPQGRRGEPHPQGFAFGAPPPSARAPTSPLKGGGKYDQN